jgi:hypothetical protein
MMNTTPPPLWLCAHESGHAIARIQLHASLCDNEGKQLRPITDPSFSRIWVDGSRGKGKRCGSVDTLRKTTVAYNEAVVAAAGPVAQMRVQKDHGIATLIYLIKELKDLPRVSEGPLARAESDYTTIWKASQVAKVSLHDVVDEAVYIVDRYWQYVLLVARQLQQKSELSFSEVAELLRLGQKDGMRSCYGD